MARSRFRQLRHRFALFAGLLLTGTAHAATYSANPTGFAWIDPATHTNVVWTAAPGGPANQCTGGASANNDDITVELPLGFTFRLGTVNYTTVRIMTNGRLQFNNRFCAPGTAANGPPRTYRYPMPDTRLVRTLRVYGADLNPGAGGTVRYASLGSAPNRYFVATWSNVPEFNSPGSSFNLQVILHENGEFVYQYGASNNPSQGHAQIGWEINTDDYELYPYTNITTLQNTALRFSADDPTALLYYTMDETGWSGAAGEIIDNSGNGYHGQALGSATTIFPGYICNGGNMPNPNAGMATPVNIRNTIGSRGTITFWYNNATAWNSGNTMLADASANLGNDNADKYFFLVKRSNGRLRFRIEDSADADLQAETSNNSYAANTWHHVAITWDITEDADYLQIYIDGTRRATSRGNRTAPLNITSTLGNLNTLFLGVSRENGIGGNGYSNTGARGIFDETRIYTEVLSRTQVIADRNQTHACVFSQWNMDQLSWNGTANEVIDSSGNGYHGTAVNGATTGNATPAIPGSPGTCSYGSFDGVDDYVALSNFPNLTDNFTITAWIRPNIITGDQRIFADDQSNSGGYALSLGDPGAGRLRFFSRNLPNPQISLDSGAVITANTWQHVAIVHDASNKRRQIFVNGAAVTAAQNYGGNWGVDNGPASIGGETNGAGAEAASRFRFNGFIDEVRVYARTLTGVELTGVMNETRPCAASVHHFRIEHDGTGLTCEPDTVTVRACSNSTCSSLYTGSASVTLSPSGWVGGDTKTITGGVGTFQLRQTTAQTVNLGVTSSSPAASNAPVCLNTATSSNSCAITYHTSGFIYSIPTQTSCASSNAITISAVRMDDTSQACVPTFVSQSRNVVFSLNYANPASGTRSLTLNHNSTNYTPINDSTSQTVPVSFNGSGQATFTLTYPDAGQVTLNARYTGSAASGDAGLIMNGAQTFVTKPYKFYVFSDDANSDCATASPSCSVFKRAGEGFNLKVRAACADNSVTPNFQLAGMGVSHTNVAPAIVQGSVGVSSFSFGASDNGERVITNQSVSEVGAYTFTAALPAGGYFGETVIGNTALNTSANIGRFIPDHFCLSVPSLTNRTDTNTAASCTDGFNYLDEDLTTQFTLSAQAMGVSCGGAVLQNYSGAWSRFSTPFAEDPNLGNEAGKWNFGAVNNPSGTPVSLNGRIVINTAASTPANGQFSNGQINISARLRVTRSGSAPNYTPEAPLSSATFGVNPVDNDNVRLDTTNLTIGADSYRQIGATALYFGRLYADNAFGPENLALPMWAQSQYCATTSGGVCSSWLAKTDDSCTLFTITPPAQTAIGANSGSIGGGQGYYFRASPTVPSGSYNFTGTQGRVHVPDTSNHSAGWQLFYTGGGNGGDFLIPFNTHPYLRLFNGTASFGQFRGDDRIIIWREVLQ